MSIISSRRAHLAIVFLLATSTSALAEEPPPDGAQPADDGPVGSPPADATPSEAAPADAPVTATPPATAPSDDAGPAADHHHKKKKKKNQQDTDPGATDAIASKHAPSEDALGADQGDIVSNGSETEDGHGVNFRFLFQTRYLTTFSRSIDPATTADPRLNDGYTLNRIFTRLTTKPKPWMSAKLLIDWAEITHRNPKKALKLAYAEFAVDRHVVVTIGMFKRTFSLLELLPIADFEVADVGPTDVLIKDAEIGGRDPGAMIRTDPLHKRKRLNFYLGVFRGGLGGTDARAAGLLTARLTSEPIKHLKLGIDGAWRPHGQTVPAGVSPTTGEARAMSADVSYERKRYELRTEWLWGDRADEVNRGDARTFMAAWGIAAVKIPVRHDVVMPAARFEWLDADREHGIGSRYLMTLALNVMDVADSVRVLVDVSRTQVHAGTFPLSVPPVLTDISSTAAVVQVQVKI